MVARVFTFPKGTERNREIAKLAATFLTLDHLIITDRFADFVRRFTLRAAVARFSLRDTDFFFRNYDRDSEEFDAVARRVVAGIEHLFYVSPYELSDLVREIRLQNYSRAYDLVIRYAQELCDRGSIAFEVLGAEPLALLIKQHVLDEEQRDRRAHAVHLGDLAKDLTFLLTATNFTTRKLEIIGSKKEDRQRVALLDALLASSAFPGIFRPRWAREIYSGNNSVDQYIDGGVLDNLPLRAVVKHLYDAASNLEIEFRPSPKLPHLILTASLEQETKLAEKGGSSDFGKPEEAMEAEAKRIGNSWPAAWRRAKRLRYNQKIDRFRKAQLDLRFLYDRYAEVRGAPVGVDTLDIEVAVVKPKWVCGTFAFHPMLGFRRERQAASIAHGCAATFQTIARIVAGETEASSFWPAQAWDMDVLDIAVDNARRLQPLDGGPKRQAAGLCHFRKFARCPFSPAVLDSTPGLDEPEVKAEIARIYALCGQKATHEHPPDR